MPETIATIISTATLTEASVLTFNEILALTYAATAAATIGIGQHQRRRMQAKARDRFNASLEDRLVMTATAQAARSRVYGRARNVDGVLFKATHGTNREYYTLVVAVAGHEVDAIEDVYFNDVPVTLDGSGYVQTEPWLKSRPESASASCTVTSGSGVVVLANTPISGTVKASIETFPGSDFQAYTLTPGVVGTTVTISSAPVDGTWTVTYQYTLSESKARVRKYLGTAGQDLYPVLQPLVGSVVQSDDHFDGIACLVCTFQYDQEAFASGVPNVSAVVRGARIYDSRGPTTAWSENPALIARDWALHAYGGGCVTAELDESSFTAAANACDTSTTFTTDVGSETRPLYQCGIVIPLDADPEEAFAEIVEAMGGQWGWVGGRLRVRAGVYRAPVAVLTEDWCTDVGAIEIVGGPPVAEALNVMRPSIADAARAYVRSPLAEVRAAAYVTADGRDLPAEIDLGGVTRAVHAQHIAGVQMREAREGLTVKIPCNWRAFQPELFDVLQVTLSRFGWAAKLFEVQGWSLTLDGGVQLTLRETAAAIFTPDAVFDTLTVSPNTALARPTVPAQVADLAVTSGTVTQVDGSVLARATATWLSVADEAVRQSGHVELQYVEATASLPSGDWPAAPPVAGRATRADVLGLRIGGVYVFRARARNTLGAAGPWSAHYVHQIVGTRRNKVFIQPGTPTGIEDDVWYDTDDGHRRYVYRSGAWVAVDVGTGGISGDAVTKVYGPQYSAGPISRSNVS